MKFIQRYLLGRELERLYDSEINAEISSFWDGGWTVKLGDKMNGFHFYGENTCYTFEDIIEELRDLAEEHFPNSTYVKNLNR